MLWIFQIAVVAPQVGRLRPFGFGFGHGRVIVVLAILVALVVIALISRRNGR